LERNGIQKYRLELFHLIEMAQYYEHKIKDIEFALVLVEKAVQTAWEPK
jgi:hypothetical protein